jgi:hypothetical protein
MKAISSFLQPRLQFLVVIAGFILVAALAFAASRTQLALVLVLPFGLAGLWAFIRWPSFGLLVAAVAGMLVPFTGPSGLTVTMMMVALMLGLWLFDMVARQRAIHMVSSRTFWPLFIFVVVACISFVIGQLPWLTFAMHAPLGAQLGGLAIIVLSAAIFLLVANLIEDLRWLNWITWAFVAVGALSVIVRSVLPELGLSTRSLLPQMGTVFYIWLVAIGFSQAVFNQDLHPRWRMALGALVLLTLYILFFWKYADKSGWLSCFVCIGAIVICRYPRAIVAMIPFGILAVRAMWSGIVSTDEYSVTTRLDAWIIVGQIIKINPIWGLGFANYYWYTPLFPIRGYAVQFNSHNNYVDIAAETGIIGLACYVWLLWEVGRLAWQLKDQVPDGFARAYVYGALGGLAAMITAGMLGDWVLPFFYNVGMRGFPSSMLGWFFLGGLVSLANMKTLSKFKNKAANRSTEPSFYPRSVV